MMDTKTGQPELASIPAPKSWNIDPATVRPVVVVDKREQAPLPFRRLQSVQGTLTTGDYSALGLEKLLAVERKSVADLVGCCTGENRKRFERELHRLRGFRFKRLVVVGCRAEVEQHRYRGNVSPKAILASLSAWEIRFDVPVVWAGTPEEAGQLVESWIWWTAREIVKESAALMVSRHEDAEAPTAATA